MPKKTNKRVKNTAVNPAKKMQEQSIVARGSQSQFALEGMAMPGAAGAVAQGQAAQPMQKRVLHVGCGQNRKDKMPRMFHGDEWQEIRLDIDASVKPDIVSDIMDMKAVPTGSMDALFSSHNLEHVFAYEVPKVLGEFFRVLKPGGLVAITLPDIQSVAFAVAEGKLEVPLYQSPAGPITPLDILYGFHRSMMQGHHYMAHKTAFTAETLGTKAQLAGFTQVVVNRDNHYNLWLTAYKLPKNHPNYTDSIRLNGSYSKTVVALPNPEAKTGMQVDDLDAAPKIWKPLGLKASA